MSKHGKRYDDAVKQYDKNTLYEAKQALELVKNLAKAKFDETIEIAFKLGVDPRHADQQVRGAVVLPHETAGADFVGAEDMIAKIQGGWFGFEVAVATPDMMGMVGKLGKLLGPKGLMPNPKVGTVTFDVDRAVKEIKAGKVEYRVDKTGIVAAPIGKASFDLEKLQENYQALVDALIKAKPAGAKGQYIKTVTVSSTMGPGVRLNPLKLS